MDDDELMEFLVSGNMDDWSHAVSVKAYDIGEAVDEYHRLMAEKRETGEVPSLTPEQHLYVKIKDDDQVYEFASKSPWKEDDVVVEDFYLEEDDEDGE
ncbi:MAG: hypothetical protein ACYDBB_11705 [Armatimonadota bacterium]